MSFNNHYFLKIYFQLILQFFFDSKEGLLKNLLIFTKRLLNIIYLSFI